MKSLRKNELVPLRDCLNELLDFFQELKIKETPYFLKYVERMKYNLEICIIVQYVEWEKIEQILKRDWKAANHRLIGIPGMLFCEEVFLKSSEQEIQFIELIARIEAYFRERNLP